MSYKIIILHGWQGYPEENWYPWLKSELEKKGHEVIVPYFPEPDYPDLGTWVRNLKGIVGSVDETYVFVGHSLGCVTILRFLESLKDDQKIGGAVLVAAPSGDLGIKEILSFVEKPFDWGRIRSRCRYFSVINSDDDPYIPTSHAYVLKDKLRAKLIIKKRCKHLSAAAGFLKLPIVLKEILRISKKNEEDLILS